MNLADFDQPPGPKCKVFYIERALLHATVTIDWNDEQCSLRPRNAATNVRNATSIDSAIYYRNDGFNVSSLSDALMVKPLKM